MAILLMHNNLEKNHAHIAEWEEVHISPYISHGTNCYILYAKAVRQCIVGNPTNTTRVRCAFPPSPTFFRCDLSHIQRLAKHSYSQLLGISYREIVSLVLLFEHGYRSLATQQ